MVHTKNQKTNKQLTFFLIFSLLILWLTPVLAGKNNGGDTPKAVFKAAQEAGAKKDFTTLVKLVAPSERPMLALGTDMGVGMFVEFYEGEKAEALKKKYQEIQNKYKIKIEEEDESEKLQVTQDTPQEVIDAHLYKRAEKLYGHVDVTSFVPDLMALILNMPEMAEQSVFPQEKLSDLKIEGDHASAKSGEETVHFIREGGRWYLTADVMK
ncbi:hypothetical protein JW835_09185 [bacterium]|nr:hypothetical protein [bacterium]